MSFQITKEVILKSGLCPPGLTPATLVKVYEPYIKESKQGPMTVQQVDFETDKGYTIPMWFNSVVMGNLIEFVAAADKVQFNPDTVQTVDIELKEYVGKEIVLSISHGKSEKDGKVRAQIDNFYETGKVPF